MLAINNKHPMNTTNTYTLNATRFNGTFRDNKNWNHPLPSFEFSTFDQIKAMLGTKRNWNIEHITVNSYEYENGNESTVWIDFKTSAIQIKIPMVHPVVSQLLRIHGFNQYVFKLLLNRKCTHTIIDQIIATIARISCETISIDGFESYKVTIDEIETIVRPDRSFDKQFREYNKLLDAFQDDYFTKAREHATVFTYKSHLKFHEFVCNLGYYGTNGCLYYSRNDLFKSF